MNVELGYVVYIDWNVIAIMQSGSFPLLEKKLFEAKNRKAISIPFSSTHISEACNIESEDQINKRLAYISKLSSNLSFLHDLRSTGFKTQEPKASMSDDIDKLFINIISFDDLKYVRNLLKLDPSKLNNISPKEAICEIDKALASKENRDKFFKDYNGDISFIGLIKTTLDIIEQKVVEPLLGNLYHQNKYNRSLVKINLAFSFLDSFGFWSDNKETYKRGSRIADGMHAFNGTFANLVISADRRFCMKSRAVYSILDRKPKVLHLKTDENEIMEILDGLVRS
jgi:hypothetical protein